MKKCALVTLVMALSIAILSSWCLAQNVTNTSKEGSLLIWPKIITTGDNDTYVMISNSYGSSVNVKCYWEYKDISSGTPPYFRNSCDHTDFQFRLTGNQPMVFSAKTGRHMWDEDLNGVPDLPSFGEDAEGILKCWAVDADAQNQISWNYLKGEALIINETIGSAWEYNAWRFAAVGVARRGAVGTGGTIAMTGSSGGYDACPSYLVFNFLANDPPSITSDLTLIPCRQDLRQEGTNTKTKATFTIWNEDEVKYTGAHQCFNCYLEAELGTFRIPQDTGKILPFSYDRLHTYAARVRVKGVNSAKYCPGSIATGLLGVINTRMILDGVDYADRFGGNPTSTSAKWNPPSGQPEAEILWDKGPATDEKRPR